MEITKEKSELMAIIITPLLDMTDMILDNEDGAIEYLKKASAQIQRRLGISQALPFANQFNEDKTALEIKTLNAVITLLKTRKEQQDKMPELLKQKEQSQRQFEILQNII